MSFFSCAWLGSSGFRGVDATSGSELWILCILTVGFGDIGGGVAFDLMERDLFGGNAGGRLELFVASTKVGVAVAEILQEEMSFSTVLHSLRDTKSFSNFSRTRWIETRVTHWISPTIFTREENVLDKNCLIFYPLSPKKYHLILPFLYSIFYQHSHKFDRTWGTLE